MNFSKNFLDAVSTRGCYMYYNPISDKMTWVIFWLLKGVTIEGMEVKS